MQCYFSFSLWIFYLNRIHFPLFVHSLIESSCSPYLFSTNIDPQTNDQYVQPCPVAKPCQCICQIESKRLWIDCFHRQLEVIPNFQAIPTDNTILQWNIDLAFNSFENLSAFQWIPTNMNIQHLIFSGALAYDLIVQLNLSHRHLIDSWSNEEHFSSLDDDDEENPNEHIQHLTELSVRLRAESKPIKHFHLSLSGERFSVSIVYLDHNHLTSIPTDALYNATGLYELYLSYNHLEHLPAYAFGFSHRLTRLDLSYNQISSIDNFTFQRHPNGFAGPFLIDYLDLSHNHLTNLTSNVFSYLVNLRLLKLEHNQIHSLSAHVWTGLYRLKYLDLSHNYLQNFTHVFYNSYLNELNHLKITSNNLSQIGSCEFLSFKALTNLNLSGNNLSTLDTCAFYGLPHFQLHIHLRSNHFQSLHPCTFINFARSTIHIENNPLICNCSFNYLLYDRKSLAYTGQECRGGFAYPSQTQLTSPAVRKSQKGSEMKRLNTLITCRNAYKYYTNLCSKSDCSRVCSSNERLIIQITTMNTRNRSSSNFPRTFLFFYVIFGRQIFEY